MVRNLKNICAAVALAFSLAPAFAISTTNTGASTATIAAVNDTYDTSGDATTSYSSTPLPGYILSITGPQGSGATGINIPTNQSGYTIPSGRFHSYPTTQVNYINVPQFNSLSLTYLASHNASNYLAGGVQTSDGYYYYGFGTSKNLGSTTYAYKVTAPQMCLSSGTDTVIQAAFAFYGGTDQTVSTIQTYSYSVNGSPVLNKFKYSTTADSEFNLELSGFEPLN